MEIIPITQDQIIMFVSASLIPAIIDILRVVLFQLAMKLKLDTISNFISESKFGLYLTVILSGVFGVLLAVWLGEVSPTVQSVIENSLVVLGWSQIIYKGGYDKSTARKLLTSVVDKIGVKSDEKGDIELVG